jgi:hypothetical protein
MRDAEKAADRTGQKAQEVGNRAKEGAQDFGVREEVLAGSNRSYVL